MKNLQKIFIAFLLVFLASCGNLQNHNSPQNSETIASETAQNNFQKDVVFEVEKDYPITTSVENYENSTENHEKTIIVKPKIENAENIMAPVSLGVNHFSGDIVAPLNVSFASLIEPKTKPNFLFDIFTPNSLSGSIFFVSNFGRDYSYADVIDKHEDVNDANHFVAKFAVDGEKMNHTNNWIHFSVNTDIHHEKNIEKIIIDLSGIRDKVIYDSNTESKDIFSVRTYFDPWDYAVLADMTEEEIDLLNREGKWDSELLPHEKEKIETIYSKMRSIAEKYDADNNRKIFYTTIDGKRIQATEDNRYYAYNDVELLFAITDWDFLKNIATIEIEFPPLPDELKISPKYKDNLTIRRPDFADADYRDERFGIFGYKEKPLIEPKNNPEKDAVTFALTAEKISENAKIKNIFVDLWSYYEKQYEMSFKVASGSMIVNSFVHSPEFENQSEVFTDESYGFPMDNSHPLGFFKSGFYGVQEPLIYFYRIFKKRNNWLYSQTKIIDGIYETYWTYWSDRIAMNPEKLKNIKKFIFDFSDIKDFIVRHGFESSGRLDFVSNFALSVENFTGLDNPNVEFIAVKSSGERVNIPFEHFEDGKQKTPQSLVLWQKKYNQEWKLSRVSIGAFDWKALSEYEKFEIIFE